MSTGQTLRLFILLACTIPWNAGMQAADSRTLRWIEQSSSAGEIPSSFSMQLDAADSSKTITPSATVGADTNRFTPKQDTAYHRAKRVRVSARSRFHHDIVRTDSAWKEEEKRLNNLPEAVLKRNLEFSARDIMPTGRDVINHAKQYSPGIPPDYIPYISQANILSIPFSMGGLLGYEEDVSPSISYSVRQTSDVFIVIYSISADTVAHPFHDVQSSGGHTFVWNDRDDAGNPVPPGDYVAEVSIGDSQIVRKHIQVK
jgi:hypothetical protein